MDYKERILAIMQEMENDDSLELDEYAKIMGEIATDAEQRTQGAMQMMEACKDIADAVDCLILANKIRRKNEQ